MPPDYDTQDDDELENRFSNSRLAHFERYCEMSNDKIELVNRPAGWFRGERWFWRIVAANGQTLATSEMYESKQSRNDSARRQADQHGYELVENPERIV